MVGSLFRRVIRASPQPAHYVFAAVFCARLIVLARLTGSASFFPSGGDAHFYDEWARRIAAGQWTDHHAFYGLPLYAYWLAGVYKVFGAAPFMPALIQIAFDSATATLIFLIGRRVFSEETPLLQGSPPLSITPSHTRAFSVGLAAAAGWALFVPAQAYSVILMPTAFGTFIFWLVVFQLIRRESAPTPRACLFLGGLIGFAAMGIATVSILIPLVVAAVLLKPAIDWQQTSVRRKAVAILLLACGLALGSAPCWAHNFLIAREPVILSAHSGVNFWIGNNPDATGYPHFPGLRAGQSEMLEDSIAVAEKEVGHPLLRSEVSAFWSAKARNYIQSDLWGWGKLLLTKAGNFWNAFEYDDLSVIRRLEDEGIVLPGGRFGLIAAFGIAGATLALQRYRRTRWIGAAVLLQMAAVLPVFVTERYRIVAVPGLLLFAGFGVVWLWHALVQFRWKAALGYLLLLAAATAFVSLPRTDPNLWALAAYNSGRQALERGDFAQAQAELLRARAYAPGNAEVSFVLGNVQLAKGDRLRARLYYNETLAADSSNKRALNNLGLIALDEGLPGEAESYLRRALREESNSATTHYLLARSLREQQKSEAAKVEIQEAIKLKPDQLEFNALRELIEKDSASAGER